MENQLTIYDDMKLYRETKNKIYIRYIKNFREERKTTRTEYLTVLKDKCSLPEEIIKHIISFIPIPIKNPLTNTDLCDHIFKEFLIAYYKKY